MSILFKNLIYSKRWLIFLVLYYSIFFSGLKYITKITLSLLFRSIQFRIFLYLYLQQHYKRDMLWKATTSIITIPISTQNQLSLIPTAFYRYVMNMSS